MAYLILGVGQAGCAIVDEMFANNNLRRFAQGYAINSTIKDLLNLRHIPRDRWLGISEKDGLVRGRAEGFEGRVTGGFGKDPQMAAKVMARNFDALVEFFKETFPDAYDKEDSGVGSSGYDGDTNGVPTGGWTPVQGTAGISKVGLSDQRAHVPFALVVLGLGGGTGSGSTGAIVRALRAASAVHTNVIVVGILPATHETGDEEVKDDQRNSEGALRQAWNTRWALNDLESVADGIILADNDRLSRLGNVEQFFPQYNRYLASCLLDLISGPALEEIDMSKFGELSLPVIDVRDIISAISFGDGASGRQPGYATVGRAGELTLRFPGYVVPGIGRRKVDPNALLQLAREKQTIAGSLPERCHKNLALVRMPYRLAVAAEVAPLVGVMEGELGALTVLGETHFGISLTKRRMITVCTLLTYKRDEIGRLRNIERLAELYEERTAVTAL